MLPCAVSRGRFGNAWMSMTVSFGSEAEGAARAQDKKSENGAMEHPAAAPTLCLVAGTLQHSPPPQP
eukprot:scaffold591_cov121-Isochrysis_galbana.AAC.3